MTQDEEIRNKEEDRDMDPYHGELGERKQYKLLKVFVQSKNLEAKNVGHSYSMGTLTVSQGNLKRI